MTPTEFIAARLRQTIGLDPASLGPSAVALAVHARMKQRGVKRTEDYAVLVETSEGEFAELVEEMVIPETWFFRDRQPFVALARWAAEEWLPAHPHQTLRALSVPCASGEEPYSIVMALLDAGIPADRFVAVGIDISLRSLARARLALYGKNSFRGAELGFRDRHFRPTPEGWRLSEEVRRQVHFRQGNLLDPLFAGADAQ